MSPKIYIGFVVIDPSIAAKIRARGVTEAEVREAVQWPATSRSVWEDHPKHGKRVVAFGTSSAGRRILAWLHPVDPEDGTWSLRTARAED